MAELADAHDSGSCGESRAGSSPVTCTITSGLIGSESYKTIFVYAEY